MDFEKDILISYAHIDDEAMMEGEKGWIENFHRSLEIRLSQLLGEKPKIWRDPKLQGNDYFGDEIVDQFPQIALLISIISPRYVRSEWCVREVEEFIKACEKNIGIRIQNKSRIFKVIKTPIDLDDHPEPIKGLLGYDFFNTDPQTGRPKEFSKMFGKESELAYWSKLNDVAHDITLLLQNLKVPVQASGNNAIPQSDKDQIKVYLSETSHDLQEYREGIKRELSEHGFAILPDKNLPLEVSAFSNDVIEMMEQCQLSIHLIGNKYGIVPEGTDQSTLSLQNEIALQVSSKKSLKRLIWLPPNLAPEEDRQKQFLEHLKTNSEMHKDAELLESSIEDFKYAIHKRIKEVQASMIVAKPNSNNIESSEQFDSPPIVYLICDQRDIDKTNELEDALFNAGLEVVLPVFDGEEGQIRLDHQENLKACDAVLIYYGEGNELWMRSKTRELLKIAGYGRSTPLKCKGVFLAAPAGPQKQRFRAQDTIIIDATEGFDNSKISDYIDNVKKLKK